uniref:Uncharacterized protein n=1 Tax=Ficedula albicollis TaxID=59894 RepID=A0A803VAF8_FICAL
SVPASPPTPPSLLHIPLTAAPGSTKHPKLLILLSTTRITPNSARDLELWGQHCGDICMFSSETAAAAGHFPVWAQICCYLNRVKNLPGLRQLETGGNDTYRAPVSFVKIKSRRGK